MHGGWEWVGLFVGSHTQTNQGRKDGEASVPHSEYIGLHPINNRRSLELYIVNIRVWFSICFLFLIFKLGSVTSALLGVRKSENGI